MSLHIKRCISFLLILVLLVGMIPTVNAAEITEPTIAVTEATVPPSEEPPVTDATEISENTTGPPETAPVETDFTEDTLVTEETVTEEGITSTFATSSTAMAASASTISGVKLFDQASPNYTTYLSSQLTVKYKPNGTGSSKTAYLKNLGWHFARINNVAYEDDPLYCIEPCKDYPASTSGNYVDNGVTVDGSGSNAWYSMPESYRNAIGLILLYSEQLWDDSYSVKTTAMANNPNVPVRIATQFLIYEIVCGLRDAETFERKSSNGYTKGDIFYNAGVSNVSNFAPNYNSIVSSVQAAMTIPSFTAKTKSAAPTIELTGEETSVYDSNGVLRNFTFRDRNGAAFDKSGNTLYITQTGAISDSSVHSAYRSVPSATESSFSVYYSGSSSYQTCVNLYTPEYGNLYAYFKLKAPATGNIEIIKTTNTGENLGGWQIGIYTDSSCTSPIAGSPFTTASDGTITVENLTPGTYYAKEIPVSDTYWKCDPNVKTVIVTANNTATVTFENTHYGCIRFVKTTNTGENLGGWTFRLIDEDGNQVGEFTTDDEGFALVENLLPGRYTTLELPVDDDYWTGELGFHTIIVTGGETAVDTWLNKDQGLGWFYKTTDTGNDLEGWEITVFKDDACTEKVTTLTTLEDGKIGMYLDPGIYYAKETGDTMGRFEDGYWVLDSEVKQFEIKCHEDTAVYFKNSHGGKIQIRKSMESSGPVEGWQFRITDADGKEIAGSPFTTDAKGSILTGTILPGTYTIEEIIPEDSPYYCKSENPQTVAVAEGQTAEVSFTNALKCAKISIEKIDNKGSHLSGATFLLEWSEDGNTWAPVFYSDSSSPVKGGCSNAKVQNGCLTSGSDGILEWNNIMPGLYYRVKETKAPEGYNLLKKFAFNDQITAEDLHITIRVINTRVFTLPQTGADSLTIISLVGVIMMGICLSYLISQHKKRYL